MSIVSPVAGDRKEFWLRVVLILMVLFIVLSILTIGYLVSKVRETQTQSTARGQRIEAILNDNQRTSDLLLDCTTPGGQCYERGQKNQAKTLATIGEQFVYAIYCNNRVGAEDLDKIRKCMVKQTKKAGRHG